MGIKFLQHAINQLSGRTQERHIKDDRVRALNADLAYVQHREIAAIEKEFDAYIASLNINGIQQILVNLENAKAKEKSIAEAMKLSLHNNLTPILNILNNPKDHYSFLGLINYEPLHLLTALQILIGIDFKASIIKLLECDAIDYQFESYSVTPAIEIFKMGDELRNVMRARILKDILIAIENDSFDKVLRIINFDKEYFRTVIVPNSEGKTLIFFAMKNLAQFSSDKNRYNFVQTLINDCQFDLAVVDKNNQTCVEYVSGLIAATAHINFRTINFAELGVETRISSNPAHDIIGVQHYELIKTIELIIALPEHNLTSAEQQLFNPTSIINSTTHITLNLQSCNISLQLARFIVKFIIPKIKGVEFGGVTFADEAAQLIFEGIANVNDFKQISLIKTNVTDSEFSALIIRIKLLRELGNLTVSYNEKLTNNSLYLLSQALTVDQNFLPKCEISLAGFKEPINSDELLQIYTHMHKHGTLSRLELNNINVDSNFLQGLANLINGHKISSICVQRMNLDLVKAQILISIINSVHDLNVMRFGGCISDAGANQVLSTLKHFTHIPIRSIHQCQIEDFNINPDSVPEGWEEHAKLLKDAVQIIHYVHEFHRLRNEEHRLAHLTSWKDSQLTQLRSLLSGEKKILNHRVPDDGLLFLNLTADNVAHMQKIIEPLTKSTQISTKRVLQRLRKSLQQEVLTLRSQFVRAYFNEISDGGLNNWSGSTADLNVIARILSCSICLHCDGPDATKITNIYGSHIWGKKIHIVRRGHVYHAFYPELQLLQPNVADDLNLFRACIQAGRQNTDASDIYAIELRRLTSECFSQSYDLCKASHQATFDEFFAADTDDKIYYAVLNLPQLNFAVVEKIISYRRMFDALPALKYMVNMFGLKNSHECSVQNISVLLDSLAMVHSSVAKPWKLGRDHINNIDLSAVDFDKLQSAFDGRVTVQNSNIDSAVKSYQEDLEKSLQKKHEIESLKRDAIQKLVAQINEERKTGLGHIQAAYDENRKQTKKAMTRAAITTVASCVGLSLFGEALKLAVQASTALNAVNAKLVADTLITTFVQQVVNGAKLKRFPETFAKNLLVAGVASGATNLMIDNNTVKNILNDATREHIRLVTQKTIESMGHSAFKGQNIFKQGASTAAATSFMAAAIGVGFRYDANNCSIILDVSTAALKSTLLGANSHATIQAAVLQAIQSGVASAFSGFISHTTAEPMVDLNRPQNRRDVFDNTWDDILEVTGGIAPATSKKSAQQKHKTPAATKAKAEPRAFNFRRAAYAGFDDEAKSSAQSLFGETYSETSMFHQKYEDAVNYFASATGIAHRGAAVDYIGPSDFVRKYGYVGMQQEPSSNIGWSFVDSALNLLVSPAYGSELEDDRTVKYTQVGKPKVATKDEIIQATLRSAARRVGGLSAGLYDVVSDAVVGTAKCINEIHRRTAEVEELYLSDKLPHDEEARKQKLYEVNRKSHKSLVNFGYTASVVFDAALPVPSMLFASLQGKDPIQHQMKQSQAFINLGTGMVDSVVNNYTAGLRLSETNPYAGGRQSGRVVAGALLSTLPFVPGGQAAIFNAGGTAITTSFNLSKNMVKTSGSIARTSAAYAGDAMSATFNMWQRRPVVIAAEGGTAWEIGAVAEYGGGNVLSSPNVYSSKQVPTSLGHSRAELKNYLNNINFVPREQLVQDLNFIGFKYTGGSGDGKYCKFIHPERGFSVRIDDVHSSKRSNGCKYQHIHLFDKQGNSLNVDLKIVPPSSPDAHIKISELIKLLELKL